MASRSPTRPAWSIIRWPTTGADQLTWQSITWSWRNARPPARLRPPARRSPMHFARLALSATALMLFAASVFAQMSPEDMTVQIERVHGKSAEFATAFDEVTAAMRDGDAETVASYGAYPLEVAANGEVYDILEEGDFTSNWNALLL